MPAEQPSNAEKRRANLRLAAILAIVALVFYASMFVVLG
jgi:hypothetical protein